MSTIPLETSVIILVISVSTSGIIVAMMGYFMYTYLKDRSKSDYDFDRNRAILSDIRHSYEKQIAMLNIQMTATEQRWIDANHLLLSGQNSQPDHDAPHSLKNNDFLKSHGVSDEELDVEDNLVFVLTPFHQSEESIYRTIQEACRNHNLICIRGDETYSESDILSNIIKSIVRSRIIIANITSRNPNVFYELGIAQAIGKQTILVSKAPEDAPFDVKTKRMVAFENKYDLEKKLTKALDQILNE